MEEMTMVIVLELKMNDNIVDENYGPGDHKHDDGGSKSTGPTTVTTNSDESITVLTMSILTKFEMFHST